MKNIFTLLAVLLISPLFAQDAAPKFNLDFEELSEGKKLPTDWIKWGDYPLEKDSVTTQSGNYSMRIETENGESFGCVAYQLPANYKGKKITLEGYVKYENARDGFVGLLMRLDKQGASVAFDNMQRQKLQGTQDWKKYTIDLNFKGDPDKVYVGGIMVGKGKAWFDNFKVYIDGKPIESLKQVEIEPSLVDKDIEFDGGSKFSATVLNDTQKRNLFVLGKVWGFVKYHHPAIAKGTISWDYELFRILPKINEENFDNEVVQWINKLGTFKTREQKLPDTADTKLLPNNQWLTDTNLLSAELTTLLQKINKADRSSTNYYLAFHNGVNNPDFKNEKTYASMSYDDSGVKLLALFRYWNMIEYFFPNRHLMDENWDAVLKDFIPRMTTSKDQKEYTLALLELIGKVQDTHANIWRQNTVLTAFFGENVVPISLNFVENKAVVVKLQSEFKDNSVKVGDIVTEINGVKVDDWIKENIKYFPASNYSTQLRDIAGKLLRTNQKNLEITIDTGAEIKKVTLATIPNKYFREDPASHKVLNDNIGYIYPGSLKEGEIDEIMPKFMDKKGLIIDLRCYPSDFIVFSLSKYLLNEKKEFVKFTEGSSKTPGLFTYRSGSSIGGSNSDAFKGKVVILVNEVTQSNAEYTAMALRTAPNSVVLGSTTAGADGNVSAIYLPGSIFTFISGIGVLTPNGSETQRVGILPDVKALPTVKGIREGKDEVLDRAITVINN
ncbi:hypothetical protein FLJC2902T_03250 [Flavobacterium limnosediminis JC2902]|uniref:Tail specific protease domain-containing protein n=1 Tax=Flavobacterium limnosediminis JC2902 TaxID=1341181 RepID=V6SUJ5_9FLAO|nr:S41 family peptidase [Flavobacterium limnosediminis]ESU29847.1 hypothetical protein FLJC2902T_03250 [Flavobacterium limnosediminis JC2902]